MKYQAHEKYRTRTPLFLAPYIFHESAIATQSNSLVQLTSNFAGSTEKTKSLLFSYGKYIVQLNFEYR